MAMKWIAGASTVLVLVFGVWKIEDRYATAGDVAKEVYQLQQNDVEQTQKLDALEVRIEVRRLVDYRDSLQSRVWKLDDRYGLGCAECDPAVLEIYTNTVQDIIKLDEQLKGLKEDPR